MTEKENEVIARGYDKYNGCYIVPFKKKVFGKTRTFFNVESHDVVIFTSSKLEDCYRFCDSFSSALTNKEK